MAKHKITQEQKFNGIFFFGLIFFFLGWVVFPDVTRTVQGFSFSPFIVVGFFVYIIAFLLVMRKPIKETFGF